MLKIVLWVVCAVHHPTRAAGRGSKLLLACVLRRNAPRYIISVKTWSIQTDQNLDISVQ